MLDVAGSRAYLAIVVSLAGIAVLIHVFRSVHPVRGIRETRLREAARLSNLSHGAEQLVVASLSAPSSNAEGMPVPRMTDERRSDPRRDESNHAVVLERDSPVPDDDGAAIRGEGGSFLTRPRTDDLSPPLRPTENADFPYRRAEGMWNGSYTFEVRKQFEDDPNRTIPLVSQERPPAPDYAPYLTVRLPPLERDDPNYVRLAQERPIVQGVYRSPFHAELCDETLDPCETLRDSSTLKLADDDPNRPPINLYHCRAFNSERDPPGCRRSMRGYTVMYRHRRPPRWFRAHRSEVIGDALPYSDIGRRSPFPAATNAPLPRNVTWKYSNKMFSNCNVSNLISVICAKAMGVGYGLTNRMLAYAGMMTLASRIGRHAAVDKGLQRFAFSALVNLTATVFPKRLRIVKTCDHPSREVRPDILKMLGTKGGSKVKFIDRAEVQKRPHRVLRVLDAGFAKLKNFIRPIKFHDMYLRYPYEQDMDLEANVGTIFCGLRFVRWIEDAAHVAIRRLRELAWRVTNRGSRKYAALHFRQETSDSIAMLRGRRRPTVQHAKDFLEETVYPLMERRGIFVLVVCSGPLDSAMWEGLKQKGHVLGITVVSKREVLQGKVSFDDFGTKAYDREGSVRIQVTSSDGAAADLLVMERADLALLTTTSSFSAFVYAKRCGGSVQLGSSITWNRTREQLGLRNDEESERFPGRYFDAYGSGCQLVGNVFLYDTYLDGTFTGAVEYACGYQFGEYIVAPPALVPRPPAEVDVVTFRFKPDSVLYTNISRNHPFTGRMRPLE